jgi:prolyl-tRNA synthetase
MAERSPVRGCMVIKPWGYALWENIVAQMDRMFKATGVKNAYFPLFIPINFLEKEAEHVEGFAKECAVVTHHRLEIGSPMAGWFPAAASPSPWWFVPHRKPSSAIPFPSGLAATVTCRCSSTSGPMWCAGKCAPGFSCAPVSFCGRKATPPMPRDTEAIERTRMMLKVYTRMVQDYLAIPVIEGHKTAAERFPGAVDTLCIEAMMQDRKALQAGTSHFLGQNFATASNISFQTEKRNRRLCLDHLVGHLHAHDRRPDHDPRR